MCLRIQFLLCLSIAYSAGLGDYTTNDWHFQGPNIALHKRASQLPGTYKDPGPNGMSYTANLAVDGNENSGFLNGSCSHTSNSSYWDSNVHEAEWSVDLGGFYYVTGIIIVNRKDVRDRLKGFIVYGLAHIQTCPDDGWCEIYRDKDNAYKNSTITLYVDGHKSFSVIAIKLPKHQGYPDNGMSYLTLCEVQIYAAVPLCKEISVEHGVVEIQRDTGITVNRSYTVGTVLRISCQYGFIMTESSSVKCLTDGGFNATPAICTVACKNQRIGNGYMSPNQTLYAVKTNAQVICDDGFKPRSQTITCGFSGDWSSYNYCTRVECVFPRQPNNGYYLKGSDYINDTSPLPFRSNITVMCNVGYWSKKHELRTCQYNETWSGAEPLCKMVKCSIPVKVDRGVYYFKNGSSYISGSPFYNTVLKIECNTGYRITGEKERVCQADGTWSGETACTRVTCNFSRLVERDIHGMKSLNPLFSSYHDENSNYVGERHFICPNGYKFNIKLHYRKCLEIGYWSGKEGICVLVECYEVNGLQELFYNHSIDPRSVQLPYNSVVTMSCNGTLKFSDTKYVASRCTEKGVWEQESPICEPVPVEAQAGTTESQAGLIGGAVAGVGIIITAISVVVFLLYRRRKRLEDKAKSATVYAEVTENRPANSSAYEYADVGEIEFSGMAGERAVRVIMPRKQNTEKSAIYSNTVSEQTMPVTAISSSLQSNRAYYNFIQTKKFPATAITIEDLSCFILNGPDAKERFREQFESLPQGMVEAHKEALKPKNRGKNRYRNLYAYDANRVVLQVESKSETDYINACFVDGFSSKRKYIASQGPTAEIVNDFWRMIWQTNCCKIVMLTKLREEGKEKCEQYWPDEGSHTYGSITVKMLQTEPFSQFVIRMMTIQKDHAPEKTVTQFHFTGWPDRGVPKYASSIVQFLSKVKYTPSFGNGPVVVHCSAGVGRTGTFIAIDNVTEQGRELGYIDVAGVVEAMRRQRVSSVQTLDQYIFVHQAVAEALMLSTSAMPAANFPEAFQELLQTDAKKKKRKIVLEFEALKKMSPVTEESQYVSSKLVRNRHKNRYSNVLPIEEYMPYLSNDDGSTADEYINAVFLPSYKEQKAFIIAQTPLKSTIADFWRLIWEHGIHTVIMMNSREEMTKSEVYWPEDGETVTFSNIDVTNDGAKESNKHRVISLSVKKFLVTRHIKLIQVHGWNPHRSLPESPSVILSAMELVQSYQQQTGNHTVLVHCMNGADRSGLYCVISAVIERMKIEQDVAITQVIEEMRNAREQIIPTVEQFRFCHEAVLAFIHQFDTYSNFTA